LVLGLDALVFAAIRFLLVHLFTAGEVTMMNSDGFFRSYTRFVGIPVLAGMFFISGCAQSGQAGRLGPAAIAVQPSFAAQLASKYVITSQSQLNSYLASVPGNSPLNLLPAAARSRFLASLTFNSRGLTTYRYDDLVGDLTASQMVGPRLLGSPRDAALSSSPSEVITAAMKVFEGMPAQGVLRDGIRGNVRLHARMQGPVLC
jgi:hypothetical protein